MSKHLVPWKRSVKGYKTGCQKVKHRFGPIKAGLMCLLSLSPTPFILVVPPGSCRGWTPAPRGWWILYINNKYPHDRKSSCCWHISCGVSMRWGELVWTLSPCFPHWRPGVRGTGLCVCVCVCVCVCPCLRTGGWHLQIQVSLQLPRLRLKLNVFWKLPWPLDTQ